MSAVQRIKAVHARNLAVQRSRMPLCPRWEFFGSSTTSWCNGKNDYAALWTTLQYAKSALLSKRLAR